MLAPGARALCRLFRPSPASLAPLEMPRALATSATACRKTSVFLSSSAALRYSAMTSRLSRYSDASNGATPRRLFPLALSPPRLCRLTFLGATAALPVLSGCFTLGRTATRSPELADLLHPAMRSEGAFNKSGDIEIGVEERPMQPEAVRTDF